MFIDVQRRRYVVAETPDACPRCHTGLTVEPLIDLHLVSYDDMRGPYAQTVYHCPRTECRELFIASYAAEPSHPIGHTDQLKLVRIEPHCLQDIDVPEELLEVSPTYAEILQQSTHAEIMGFNQIAGMGYRKALEFLVKDYATKLKPDDSEGIKKRSLMSVIKDYLDSKKVIDCAERAAWLGNDETHYIRRHEDHDIEDLKRLLKLTASWITHDIQTAKYIEQLP